MSTPSVRSITVFGLGYRRPASGTWGSLPPVLLAGGLIAAGLGPQQHPWIYHGLLAAVFVFFCWACVAQGDAAEAKFGKKDPSQAVADETAGQCLSLAALPAAAISTPAMATFTLAYAFICFRLLDIVKPWPAYRLQDVPGGWGILLDDLFAGAYAAILVQVMARLILHG